jgi:hypothetical protein
MRAPLRPGIAALLAALCVTAPGAQGTTVRFVDVAAEAGLDLVNVSGGLAKDYIVDANGNGAAFFDYDNDEDLDVLIVNGSTRERLAKGGDPMAALYQNDGNGRFRDVTASSGFDRRGWGSGVCVGDYDNDGNRDVYITAFGPDALWRNTGKGTFADVTRRAGIEDTRWGTSCAFGDYDRDGYLDLYVTNYVTWRPMSSAVRSGSPATSTSSTTTTETERSPTSRHGRARSTRDTTVSVSCSRT